MQNLDGRKLEFNGEIVVDIFYRWIIFAYVELF